MWGAGRMQSHRIHFWDKELFMLFRKTCKSSSKYLHLLFICECNLVLYIYIWVPALVFVGWVFVSVVRRWSCLSLPDRWLSARLLRVSAALQRSQEVKLQSPLSLPPLIFPLSRCTFHLLSVCLCVRAHLLPLHLYLWVSVRLIKEQKEPVGWWAWVC